MLGWSQEELALDSLYSSRLFYSFLTDPGDLVLDPFAGSNTTGEAAEREERKWIAIESRQDYLEASQARFEKLGLDQITLFPTKDNLSTQTTDEAFTLPGY